MAIAKKGTGMKKVIASLMALMPIWSSADPVQTLIIDDEHIQMGLPEGEVGKYYTINPARKVAIDDNFSTCAKCCQC